jgi:hypothetical protein
MRAGVAHYVHTIESSLCTGGQFFLMHHISVLSLSCSPISDIQAATKEREERFAHHYRYTRLGQCCWLIILAYRNTEEPLRRSIPYLQGLHAICVWLKGEVETAVARQEADSARWKLLKTCIASQHHAGIPRAGCDNNQRRGRYGQGGAGNC